MGGLGAADRDSARLFRRLVCLCAARGHGCAHRRPQGSAVDLPLQQVVFRRALRRHLCAICRAAGRSLLEGRRPATDRRPRARRRSGRLGARGPGDGPGCRPATSITTPSSCSWASPGCCPSRSGGFPDVGPALASPLSRRCSAWPLSWPCGFSANPRTRPTTAPRAGSPWPPPWPPWRWSVLMRGPVRSGGQRVPVYRGRRPGSRAPLPHGRGRHLGAVRPPDRLPDAALRRRQLDARSRPRVRRVHDRLPGAGEPGDRRVLRPGSDRLLPVLRGSADPDVPDHRHLGRQEPGLRGLQVLPLHPAGVRADAGARSWR